MTLLHVTAAEQERRSRRAAQLAAAKASREVPALPLDPDRPPVRTVWRRAGLPTPRAGEAGVPLSEGVSSVFAGAILYIPIALVTGYATWNYVVAAAAVVALSYALWSRRVVIGPGFVAVRKFGPYRVAAAESILAGAIRPSAHGGVLVLRTGDGRTMRLRRVEYLSPAIHDELRRMLSRPGCAVDDAVFGLLDEPWEAAGHRYLLDAVQ